MNSSFGKRVCATPPPRHRPLEVLKNCLVALFVCAIVCPVQAVSMFNVTGTETKNDLTLTFSISGDHDTALPSESWDSKKTKYQDDETDAFLSLQFWEVTFSYDAATTSFSIDAFHKIDPHSDAAKAGETFHWADKRPLATTPRAGSALFGDIRTSASKDHADSVGAHKDSYTAVAAYITNQPADVGSSNTLDRFSLELTATHCASPSGEPKSLVSAALGSCSISPVPEPSTFAILSMSLLTLSVYARRGRDRS